MLQGEQYLSKIVDSIPILQSYFRCSCSMCSVLPTARECQCCCEIEKVVRKVESFNESAGERISCITGHPGFATVCLDPYVLETAYYQYRQQYGDLEMPFVNE